LIYIYYVLAAAAPFAPDAEDGRDLAEDDGGVPRGEQFVLALDETI
jgi:hypothetical protein